MIAFFVGLLVLFMMAVLALLGFLLLPLLLLLSIFLRLALGLFLVLFTVWLMGKLTLVSIEWVRKKGEKNGGD